MIDTTPIAKPPRKLSFRGIRTSKFRHVYGSAARKENCYESIKITKNAHDSYFCAVNPKFLAVVTETAGGGSFLVLPLHVTGRLSSAIPKVTGHCGQVLDLKWNPFNDNIIASCSDDCTVKIWHVPNELLQNDITQPIRDLRGHKRRVGYIEWHPTAENIIFSAGFDYLILIWDIGRGCLVKKLSCCPDSIHSLSFNRDGSLLATTCKDKKLRIIDPRKGEVLQEGVCHHGSKASKVVFLGDTGKLLTTGFSRYNDRQWAVWCQNDLSKPLKSENIDSSSGVLFPYYDHDTKMVYIAGKGDGNIRYYEVANESPWCHYLSQHLTGFPQRGLGYMPKRGLVTPRCEVFRFYKLHATKELCEPISMVVPRKSEQFQDDIFPDTAAPTPALTADEWLNGKTRSPVLISLKSGAGSCTQKPVVYKKERRQLVTADRNNELKFVFISQGNEVDYRQVNDCISSSDSSESNFSVNNARYPVCMTPDGRELVPWLQDVSCDSLRYVRSPGTTSSDTTSEGDMETEGPLNEMELWKLFRKQAAEIKRLKESVLGREKHISELEKEIEKLTVHRY